MEEYIRILIPELPAEFTKAIHDHIRLYSVTMLIIKNESNDDVIPCSGTLCQIKSRPGIITARHVWEIAKKNKILLVMTDRGPIPLETSYIVPFVPKSDLILPDTDARVPDITFLQIDQVNLSKLMANGKVVFSIDKRISKLSHFYNPEIGYWTFFGNPCALLNKENQSVTSFIYGTSIKTRIELDGWDYCYVDLDIPDNPAIPKDFGGVSGGGIWRTNWGMDREKFIVENLFEDTAITGICFYQTTGDNSRIVAHGPDSLYKQLYEFVN